MKNTQNHHKHFPPYGLQATIVLACLFIILAAINIIAGNLRMRVDITEQKRYSLSEGTHDLLRELDQPVTLKFFFNRSYANMPAQLRAYADQVDNLLHEYSIAARGNLRVERLDPEPDSETEEWARRYGIAGQSVEMFGPPVYFGLVAAAGEVEAVLPVLDPRMQSRLEYNISHMIHQVTNPQKPTIGIVSSLPVLGDGPPPRFPGEPREQPAWIAFQELEKDFDLRDISTPDDGIPEGIDVLMIVHPKNLSQMAWYNIDQHVMRGGRLVLLVDPLSIADESAFTMTPYGLPQTGSNAAKLLDQWGLEFHADHVAAVPAMATPMRTMNGGVERNPTVLSYRAEQISDGPVITAGLQSLMAAYAGSFTATTNHSLKLTPLLAYPDDSGSVPPLAAQQGGTALSRAFTPFSENRLLAAQLNGTFTSAFPDGPPPPANSNTETNAVAQPSSPHLNEGDSVVVAIADVDMFYDPLCVESMSLFGQTMNQPINDNLSYLFNTLDVLAGGSDLVNIRARGNTQRPFDRVNRLEANAASRWQTKEAELETALADARRQIEQLQATKSDDQRFILSPEQQAAIERYREEEFDIRQQLKTVRRNLRKDIESLGWKVKLVNIGLMPLLTALAGITYGITRRHR